MINKESAKEYLKFAYQIALKSPDPRTQVGVVLLSQKNEVVTGFNEPIPGFNVNGKTFKKNKYAIMEHAERNAIFNAYNADIKIKGATLYSPWGNCVDCARAIVLSGISTVVRHEEILRRSFPRWNESIRVGEKILKRGGVEIIDYSYDSLNIQPILMDGVFWTA